MIKKELPIYGLIPWDNEHEYKSINDLCKFVGEFWRQRVIAAILAADESFVLLLH